MGTHGSAVDDRLDRSTNGSVGVTWPTIAFAF
jgi:hypothetical protein